MFDLTINDKLGLLINGYLCDIYYNKEFKMINGNIYNLYDYSIRLNTWYNITNISNITIKLLKCDINCDESNFEIENTTQILSDINILLPSDLSTYKTIFSEFNDYIITLYLESRMSVKSSDKYIETIVIEPKKET